MAYAKLVAGEAELSPEIFVRQIEVESGFNPKAGSPAGAQGIAQIIPWFHPGVDPWDPYASLRYAAQLMKGYLDKWGSYELALACYNAGSGAVEEYGGVPPFPETQKYIRLILG